MEYCVNTSKYICKSLVQYCINYCNSGDDDKSPDRCLCDCTNMSNYERLCNYSNTSKDIVVILSILLLTGGLCLICGICRSKVATYVYRNQLPSLTPSTTQSPQLAPPAPPAYNLLPLPPAIPPEISSLQAPPYDDANKSIL